jgi:hypothetical protein
MTFKKKLSSHLWPLGPIDKCVIAPQPLYWRALFRACSVVAYQGVLFLNFVFFTALSVVSLRRFVRTLQKTFV